MKKIILCVAVLLTVLCGVARADIPNPTRGRHLKSLGNLSLAERLERCNQMPDLPLDNINHIGHFWDVLEWEAMDCAKILSPKELSAACEKLKSRCRYPVPQQSAPHECCPSEEDLYREEIMQWCRELKLSPDWLNLRCDKLLPREEILQKCKGLDSSSPFATRVRELLKCDELLQNEQVQQEKETLQKAPAVPAAPAENQPQTDYLSYVFIGAGVLLICGFALWLLFRARKK